MLAGTELQTCDLPTQIFFNLQPDLTYRIGPFSGLHMVGLSVTFLGNYKSFRGRVLDFATNVLSSNPRPYSSFLKYHPKIWRCIVFIDHKAVGVDMG